LTRWLFFWFAGTAISTLSLLGFIFTAGSVNALVKLLFVLIYVFATILLFITASHRLDKGPLIALACVIALSSVCAQQLIGFGIFHGLVKDISAFECAHLQRLVIGISLALIWYFVVAVTACAITWKQARGAL
jgi:hypothetical protein